jgi:hypothetical protein
MALEGTYSIKDYEPGKDEKKVLALPGILNDSGTGEAVRPKN